MCFLWYVCVCVLYRVSLDDMTATPRFTTIIILVLLSSDIVMSLQQAAAITLSSWWWINSRLYYHHFSFFKYFLFKKCRETKGTLKATFLKVLLFIFIFRRKETLKCILSRQGRVLIFDICILWYCILNHNFWIIEHCIKVLRLFF